MRTNNDDWKRTNSLERIASAELQKYYRQEWTTSGAFRWPSWPHETYEFEVLKMASRSAKIGCKNGLINERGQPNTRHDSTMWKLQTKGLLGEFIPTDLGWAMLEHFAEDTECFPDNYKFRWVQRDMPERPWLGYSKRQSKYSPSSPGLPIRRR